MSKIDFDKLKAIENTMQPDECESCRIEVGVIESGNICDYCEHGDDIKDSFCHKCLNRGDYAYFVGKRVKEIPT